MNQKLLYGLIGILVVAFVGFIIANNRGSQAPSPTPVATAVATLEASPTASASAQEITVHLSQQNESSESGVAILSEVEGKTKVALTLTGEPVNASQPAHIHVGSCPKPGVVKYPLKSVVDGKSETTLDVDLKTLLSQVPLAINVHKSAAQINTYMACGDIQGQ